MRLDDLIRRIASDFPSHSRDEILKGGSPTSRQALPRGICGVVQQGGSYKFRKYHLVEGKPYVLFRLLTMDGNVTYHDILLARHSDGGVALDDIYLLAAGEMISQTIRRPLVGLVAQLNQSLLDRLSAKDRDYAANIKPLSQLSAASNERPDEAIAIYRG